MKLIENDKGLAVIAESPEDKIELKMWANSRQEWKLVCKLLLRRIENLEETPAIK